MNQNRSPYHEAGWILGELLPPSESSPKTRDHKQRRGLKSLAFASARQSNKGAPNKAAYATVCKTMQHLPAIKSILNANDERLRKAIGTESVQNVGLLYVMLYELLFGKYKSIRGGGQIKRMIVKCEKELRSAAEEYLSSHGRIGDGSIAEVRFPRYARVNVLQCSVLETVDALKKQMMEKSIKLADEDENDAAPLMYADAHVPDLLVLPPSASSWLHPEHDAVKSGNIILQDKSSCFPALALARGRATTSPSRQCCDYIDACAAPGNKTSHLAALLHASPSHADTPKSKSKKGRRSKSTSTIFAFERSSSRFQILGNRMRQLVPSSKSSPPTNAKYAPKVSVEPIHGDFLKADPSDPKFANVRAILLDPSCSGSGIVNSPDRWMEGNDGTSLDSPRIQSLTNFQLIALKHAMSFPNVDRIVYSTCSVHDEENEAVVSKALSEVNCDQNRSRKDGAIWELVPPSCLDHWHRRGREGGVGGLTKDQAKCLIRCDGLDGDETNGFFVSYFEKKKPKSLHNNDQTSKHTIHTTKPISFDYSYNNVPTYQGQFSNKYHQMVEKATKIPHDHEKINNKDTTPPPPTMAAPNPQTTNTKKSAKKREKKLAWKRKQALQKLQRLDKKKKGQLEIN